MEIGIDSIGLHSADLPGNVVVMQIGVSRFNKTGELSRIGYVIPRAVRGMIRMLSCASDYLASAAGTCEIIWEMRGQPLAPKPGPLPTTKLAPTARMVLQVALVILTVPMRVIRLMTRVARVGRAVFRTTARYINREFISQPWLLLLAAIVIGADIGLLR